VRFSVYWGRENAVRVRDHRELDGLLRFIAAVRGCDGAPHAVDLLPAGVADGGLQLGLGHPERAFALALDRAGGFAVRPDVEPWSEPIGFDCGYDVVDFKPAWTRLTPREAMEAAHDYAHTGERPAWLTFDANA
jgi:hypothetical protein